MKINKKGQFIATDLTGQKFGKLTVIGFSHKNKKGEYYYKCLCECGNEIIARGSHLKCGNIKTCKCSRKNGNIIHGVWSRNNRIYKIWDGIMARCYDKNNQAYKNYGGRGIIVCDEWKNPTVFEKWALNNGYNDVLTIDRIDNDGIYCPENCHWVTRKEQNRNKRNNVNITVSGETHCKAEWAEIFGYKRFFNKRGLSSFETILCWMKG